MADELEALEELRAIRDILETSVLEHIESLDETHKHLNTGQIKSIKKALLNLSASIFEKSRQKIDFSSIAAHTVQIEPVEAQLEQRLEQLSSEMRSKVELVRTTRTRVPAFVAAHLRTLLTKESQRHALPPPPEPSSTAVSVPEPPSAKKQRLRDRDARRREKKKPRMETAEDAILAAITSKAIKIEDSVPLSLSEVEDLAEVQSKVAEEARKLHEDAKKGLQAANDLTTALYKHMYFPQYAPPLNVSPQHYMSV